MGSPWEQGSPRSVMLNPPEPLGWAEMWWDEVCIPSDDALTGGDASAPLWGLQRGCPWSSRHPGLGVSRAVALAPQFAGA